MLSYTEKTFKAVQFEANHPSVTSHPGIGGNVVSASSPRKHVIDLIPCFPSEDYMLGY